MAIATSHKTRMRARKEVLPVLFSPTRSVSGARRATWRAPKHRKFSRMMLSIRLS